MVCVNWVAQAVLLVPNGTLEWIYKSAPTVFGKLVGTQKTTPSDRTANYHQVYPPLEPVGQVA